MTGRVTSQLGHGERYGRLLAYIYTHECECFYALIIEQGMSLPTYPFLFMEEFKRFVRKARKAGIGFWEGKTRILLHVKNC